MNDSDRVKQMQDITAMLRSLPETLTAAQRTNLFAAAHSIDKFARLVLDRDQGPTNDVKAENLRLNMVIETIQKANAEIAAEYADFKERTKVMREKNSALGLENTNIKKAMAEIQKANEELAAAVTRLTDEKEALQEDLRVEKLKGETF